MVTRNLFRIVQVGLVLSTIGMSPPARADGQISLGDIIPSLRSVIVSLDKDDARRELEGFQVAYQVLHQETPDFKLAQKLFRDRIKSKNPTDPYLVYDYGWGLVAAVGARDWVEAEEYYEYLAAERWPVSILRKVKVDFRKQMREALATAAQQAKLEPGAASFYEKFKNVPLRLSVISRTAETLATHTGGPGLNK